VETRGFGFLPDRRPKILFERHVFRGRTGGRFDAGYPDLSSRNPGGYQGGAAEYLRLKRAMLLDRRSALESASWGLGQVMGFNAVKIGFASVDAMISAFAESEDAQLAGCASFIAHTPALRDAYKAGRWARVAFFYNGRDYAKNNYDGKLANAHADFKANGCPEVGVRRAQAFLTYLGFGPNGIDGKVGSGTERALAAYRAAYKAPTGGPVLPAAGSSATDYLACLESSYKSRFA
jgi:hypothetical protein